MTITSRRTGDAQAELLKRLRVLARAAAAEIPRIIRARVSRGLDIHDVPFAGYDVDYAKRNGGAVDLADGASGGLLATLQVTVRDTPNGAVVVVVPDAAHARVGSYLHNGTPKMKARPWLGLSPRDLVELRRVVFARA